MMNNNIRGMAFILSYSEVMKYIPQWYGRQITGTHHWWWLRSPGNSPERAMSVGEDGCFYDNSMRIENGVRPALWVDMIGLVSHGNNVDIDGIKFKILASEAGKSLLISKDVLFGAKYIEVKQWGVPYIPYTEQVGGHYVGSIRKAVDDWFSMLPEYGYLRTNTIEPTTLASEQNFKNIDECAITHPLSITPDHSNTQPTLELKYVSLTDEFKEACKISIEIQNTESQCSKIQLER